MPYAGRSGLPSRFMAGPSCGAVVLGLQVLLLLLVASTEAQGRRQERLLLQSKPSYNSVWDAAVGESWMVQQLYGKEYNPEFRAMLNNITYESGGLGSLRKSAMNPTLNATVFIPGPGPGVHEDFAQFNCLTLKEWFAEIAKDSNRVLPYVQSFVVLREALKSSDFRDGKTLKTMLIRDGRPVTLTLASRTSNGRTEWVLKGASWKKIGGSGVAYDDVVIRPDMMDIPAGKAIVHIIDTVVRVDSEEGFWANKRKEKLAAANLTASAQCPSNVSEQANMTVAATPDSQKTAVNVGLGVGVGVGGLVLISAVLLSVLLVRRKMCCNGQKQRHGSTNALLPENADRELTPQPSPDTPQSCGSKDQGRSSSLRAGPRPPHQPSGSDMGVYVKAGSSSSTLNSSAGIHRSSGSMTPNAFGLQPGLQLGGLQIADSSPFAIVMPGGPSGLISDGRPRPPADAWGPSAANAGTSNGRHSDSRTPRSSSRSTASRSASNSGSRQHHTSEESGRDGLQPMAHTQPRGPIPSPAFNSYEGGLMPIESMPMGRIPQAMVVPYDELSLEEVIGAGAEGKVYRGTWKHTDIAAKEYLPSGQLSDSARASAEAALAKEVTILTRLNHPNLVRFCAVCLERSLMVMEYYKLGSVFDIIRRAEREMWDVNGSPHSGAKPLCQYLNWDVRLKMLHDVAAGMCYLHGRDHIHGDLRSPNLFVGTDDKVKIGDFGFTKRLTRDAASLRVTRITHPRWVAPELALHSILSPASDVYSFGIIMYELLTFKVPFETLRKEQVVCKVMQGGRPEVPPEDELPEGTSSHSCLETYIRLMEDCWAQDAAQRPTFEDIARRLKAMQRWRKLKARWERVGQTARRVRSVPVMRRGSNDSSATGSMAGLATDSFDESQPQPNGTRRTVSDPSAKQGTAQQQQEPQQPSQLAARLKAELLSPMPAPEWEPPRLSKLPPMPSLRRAQGFSSIPEVEGEEGGGDVQFCSQPSVGPPHTMMETMSSLVSSTVMQGNLAIIPTGPGVDEQDALAGIQDPKQLAAAQRVLLVASDLPSQYTQAHEFALRARRSRERDPHRGNVRSE